MREWLAFLAIVLGWAVIGRLVLEANVAHPFAVALVWFAGLVWLIGWVSGSARDADYLLKLMAGMIAAPLALVVLVTIAEYVVS